MTRTLIAGAIAALAGTASAQTAEILLVVDLSVPDQITVTATDGLSAGTVSASDTTGVLLADFYTAGNDLGGAVSDLSASGDLVNFGGSSDGSPDIFRATFGGISNGLNIWSLAPGADSLDFTAGTQAFQGSATFTLSSDDYADMINSVSVGSSGDIFAPADSDDDIAAATFLGRWTVVPTPGAASLLAVGGLAAIRRRRA